MSDRLRVLLLGAILGIGCTAEPITVEVSDDLLPVDPEFDTTFVGFGDQVVTTLLQTRLPRWGFHPYLDEEGLPRVPAEDFGALSPQPGEPHVLRDQLAIPHGAREIDWTPGALPRSSRSVLYSYVVADPQYADTDSPALVAANTRSPLGLPAFDPQWELTPHVADAAIRTANRFQEERPLDIVFVVGDAIENAQGNELATHLTVLNGGMVEQDSGARDDIRPGPNNDAFDPFIAQGLLPGTPWIAAIGNHDILINGNFPAPLIKEANEDPAIYEELADQLAFFQVSIPQYPTADVHPAFFPHERRPAFQVDPYRFDPDTLDPVVLFEGVGPASIPADPDRDPLSICDYVAAHRDASGVPRGHGFTAGNEENCTGFFTYDPVDGLPLRVISLSLIAAEGGSEGILAPSYAIPEHVGDPTHDQLAFLDVELDRAEADGVAVIVISHQVSDHIVTESSLMAYRPLFAGHDTTLELWDRYVRNPEGALTPEQFRRRLAASPNVIAHIGGHSHSHSIEAICADGTVRDSPADGRCPLGPNGETGYWEFTTDGALTFPNQSRFVELVQVDDNAAALYLTVVDPYVSPGSFAERSQWIALASHTRHAEGRPRSYGEIWDRNTLLPLWLPNRVATALAEANLPRRIESETTLAMPQSPISDLPRPR